jgi:CIC family chloride channel protein
VSEVGTTHSSVTPDPGSSGVRLIPRRIVSVLEDVFDEERYFLLLSVFIGIFSGLAVVCFRLAIDWTHLALLGPLPQAHTWRLFAVPSLAGLAVALLAIHVFPGIGGSGVNQTKAALYIFNGYIPFRTAIGKFVGAGLASALGRQLQLSREKLRLMAPVGAAAGLAAAFNAPVSAVLFVIEEVIGRWSAGILGSVVLSAVSSVVIVRGFLGSEPLFRIPVTTFKRPAELIAYAVLGIAGGVASVLFAKAIGFLRPRLKALPHWTQYFQSAVAGLLIGPIAFLGAPQVMGAGYDFMDQAMRGQYGWKLLAVLAALKIIATTLSFASGNSRRNVCSHALYRGYARWCGRRRRASLVSSSDGIQRNLCAGGHGRAVCRLSSSAHDLGVYGAGG